MLPMEGPAVPLTLLGAGTRKSHRHGRPVLPVPAALALSWAVLRCLVEQGMGEGWSSVSCAQPLWCFPASCPPCAAHPVLKGASTALLSTAGLQPWQTQHLRHSCRQPSPCYLRSALVLEWKYTQERHGPTKEELLQNWRNPGSRVKHHYR